MLPISSTAVRLTVAGAVLAAAAVGTIATPSGAHAAEPTPTAAPTASPTAAPTSAPTAAPTTVVPAPVTISIRTLKSRVDPGRSDTLTGNLRVAGGADPSGREVTLEARTAGSAEFVAVGTATTASYGGLRLRVQPEVTTRYRWAYDGAADASAQTSGVVRVAVRDRQQRARRLPTSLSVRGIDRPGTDTVKGHLRSGRQGLRGRPVVLLSSSPGQEGWRFVASRRTGRDGAVAFSVNGDAEGSYRLQFLGTTVLRPARSGVVRLAPSPDVAASASPATLDQGGTTTLTGVVSTTGAPLPSAPVDLLARPTGSRGAFQVVGSGTTGTDGAVSVAATPTRSTTYRLRVRATTTTAEGVSGAVKVVVRDPTSLSIRLRTVAGGEQVSGTLLTRARRPVRSQPVALEALTPGTTPGTGTWAPVATGTTRRDGQVVFSSGIEPGTGYRLVFAGTPRLSAATSGTVVG